MNRRFSRLVVIIFCVFIGGIGFISAVLPDKEFSEMENRNLQPFPKFTSSRWKSGRYMEELEEYISDHVVLRDQWVGLKATLEVMVGKKENNGVFFGANNTLINCVTVEDEEQLIKNVENVRSLSQNIAVPVYFGLIPTAAEIWNDLLPNGAVTEDESDWIDRLYERANVNSIDFVKTLEAHKSEEIYYHTDHHWTSLGAYYGANTILDAMGLERLDLENYNEKVVTEEFYGTIYSASGAWWSDADSISYYIPEDGKTVMSNVSGKEEVGQLYDFERLHEKNKYAFFLGGNQAHCIIQSEKNSERLLIIRDSYADCLVPFLSERFGEIHMFDLRYNRMSIKDYVEEYKIDKVLVLYSFSNYIEDENQFLLLR